MIRSPLDGIHTDHPDSGRFVRLDWPGDAAGRVFGAAPFRIIEGFGVIVKVFFGPGRFELPFVGPFDTVPAVAVVRRGFGYEENSSVPGATLRSNPSPGRSRCARKISPYRAGRSAGAVGLGEWWLAP
jgi:hypothetical protein